MILRSIFFPLVNSQTSLALSRVRFLMRDHLFRSSSQSQLLLVKAKYKEIRDFVRDAYEGRILSDEEVEQLYRNYDMLKNMKLTDAS